MNPNINVESIKKKVKKLLALSKSPNENEAITAYEKAQSLMKEYHLNEGECLYTEIAIKATKRLSKWRAILANTVATLYYCETFRRTASGKICFYGDSFDAFMAGEMYNYLAKTVERMSKQNVRKNASLKYRNNYRLGVACQIQIRLDKLGQKASWGPERDERMKAVQTALEKEISLTSEKMNLGTPDRAFKRGAIAGGTVSLHRQTTGSGGRYLEGGKT